MRAYGARRTYAKCKTSRQFGKKKVQIDTSRTVNKGAERAFARKQDRVLVHAIQDNDACLNPD